MELILLSVCIIGIVSGILLFITGTFMWNRNDKVYEARKKLLDTDYEAYKRLPSYEEMFRDFTTPVESFVEKAKRN